ncbi:MAG: chemotaxis protein CheA [Pseudomonadota bacterium]
MDFSTDESLINEFVAESRDHLDSIEPDLLAFEGGGDIPPDIINRIFRAIHSIKGSSAFLGLSSITHLSHFMENALMKIREGKIIPDPRGVDVLLAGVDRLRLMIQNIPSGTELDFSEELQGLAAMLDEEGRGRPEPRPAIPEQKKENAAPPEIGSGPLTVAVASELEPDGVVFGLDPEKLAEAAAGGAFFYALWVRVPFDLAGKGRSAEVLTELMTDLGEVLASDLKQAAASGRDGVCGRAFFGTIIQEPQLVEHALDLPSAQVRPIPSRIIADGFAKFSQEKKRLSSDPGGSLEPGGSARAEDAGGLENSSNPSLEARESPSDKKAAPAFRVGPIQETIRVSVNLIDRMMNLAGELVLGRNQLRRLLEAKLNQTKGLASILQHVDIVTTDIQEQIMQLRMQPVGNIFNKFPRVVRDLSQQLRKEVELDIEGGDVELDKSILEALSDPLTHLIRNSVDHGLEKPEERLAAGKSAVGLVALRAFHEEGQVNITVFDDGRGIDVNKVVQKAIGAGLIDSFTAARMTEMEKLGLIFTPGFSTAETITDVSGRGVGMDVVRTNIEKIGGRLEISSALGQGAQVRLRLPLTLAIIPSLVVHTSGECFAIPQMDVQELVCIQAREASFRIEMVGEADVLRLRGRLLPLVRLADVLGLKRYYRDRRTGERKLDRRERMSDRRRLFDSPAGTSGRIAKQQRPAESGAARASEERRSENERRRLWSGDVFVVVLRHGPNRFGLLVDELLNTEEIVVKPLSRHIKDIRCFSGATIMGDGRVAMILSAAGIANSALLRFSEVRDEDRRRREMRDRLIGNGSRTKTGLLLFNGARNEHFAVPLIKVSRLEKIRRDSINRIGGREFVNYREAVLPLIRLEDHLPVGPFPEDAEEVFLIIPRTDQPLAGLMASEIVDVFETETGYVPERKKRPGILGSGVLEERLTIFIDIEELLDAALSDPSLPFSGGLNRPSRSDAGAGGGAGSRRDNDRHS